ncbi:uncharacterized protein HD556DRAFT_1314251 [Suillus plorans]|uniref:Uncharacterized protein n=1 Tax=Suillus plorans TaxID=116603 RepID=A0A9P7DAX0_9AGAM|nr:uncharacterized protein HD556DRAFT_1314251 [Suillus plorans]KAG1785478.1 hypothetical protein HD556DRAFT_1314251 [Suillus plorans]
MYIVHATYPTAYGKLDRENKFPQMQNKCLHLQQLRRGNLGVERSPLAMTKFSLVMGSRIGCDLLTDLTAMSGSILDTSVPSETVHDGLIPSSAAADFHLLMAKLPLESNVLGFRDTAPVSKLLQLASHVWLSDTTVNMMLDIIRQPISTNLYLSSCHNIVLCYTATKIQTAEKDTHTWLNDKIENMPGDSTFDAEEDIDLEVPELTKILADDPPQGSVSKGKKREQMVACIDDTDDADGEWVWK